jgi:hypothetical protein
MQRITRPVLLSIALSLATFTLTAQPALAAPPSNDALRHAIAITTLPFIHREDTSEATASGPKFCSNSSSVFFSFTPTHDVTVQADTIGSNYDTTLAVFTGSHSTVNPIDCNDDAVGLASAVRLDAEAGTTYYFQVATCCGSGQDNVGGRLVFELIEAQQKEPTVEGTLTSATLLPGRIVHLTGTVTCDQRVGAEAFGTIRQLNGDLIARAEFDRFPIWCDPERGGRFSIFVDSDTGVAFRPGSASTRTNVFATNGFESTFNPGTRTRVRLDQP